MMANYYWQVENAEPEPEQHKSGDGLNREFDVIGERVDVVVNAQPEDHEARDKNRPQNSKGHPDVKPGTPPSDQQYARDTQQKGQEDRDPSEAGQRAGVHVPVQRRDGNPTTYRAYSADASS